MFADHIRGGPRWLFTIARAISMENIFTTLHSNNFSAFYTFFRTREFYDVNFLLRDFPIDSRRDLNIAYGSRVGDSEAVKRNENFCWKYIL